MNSNYNQQPPYYNYQQHIPGPPQPPWQAQQQHPQQQQGWNQHVQYGQPQPQPQPPPPPQYNQNNFSPHLNQSFNYPTYGQPGPPTQSPAPPHDSYHRPTAQQHDTTEWGVRYNQGQQQQQQQQQQQYQPPPHPPPSRQHHHPPGQAEQKPALPPRPATTKPPATQQAPINSNNRPQSPGSTQYQYQGSWNIPLAQTPEQHPTPPPPPARPPAYAPPAQYTQAGHSQDPYSHHPPTHHYDPQAQPSSGWQQGQQDHTSGSDTVSWAQAPQSTGTPTAPAATPKDENRRWSVAGRPAADGTGTVAGGIPQPSRQSRFSLSAIPDVQTSATALGAFGGNPSDWQHYNPSGTQDSSNEDSDRTPTVAQPEQFTASPQPLKAHMNQEVSQSQTHSSQPASLLQHSQPEAQPLPQSHPQSQWEGPEYGKAYPPPTNVGVSPESRASVVQTPERQGSRQSTVSSMSGAARNDTIDNVIQAWYAPLTADSSVQTSLPSTRAPTPVVQELRDGQTQTDFPPQIETRIESRVETKEIEKDPYEDIQNEYKATLKRFAGMLREEARADGDEEKFKIFQGFVIRELRLRSVLYGVEAAPQEQSAKSVPAQASRPQGLEQREPPMAPLVSSDVAQGPKDSVQTKPQPPAKPSVVTNQESSRPVSRDDSFVVVNADDDDDYSPGGRPRMATARGPKPPQRADTSQGFYSSGVGSRPGDTSPSLNAPMTLDDYVMPGRPPTSVDPATIVSPVEAHAQATGSGFDPATSAALAGPINFQPDRPVYQPFRYEGGAQPPVPEVRVFGPSNDSYTTLRQSQAAESGRSLVSDPPPANIDSVPDRSYSQTPSGGRREHEEAFVGLIRAKSQAIRKNQKPAIASRPESPAVLRAGTPLPRSTPSPVQQSSLVKSIQSLRSVVPKTLPTPTTTTTKLQPVVSGLQQMPDDFGFIHARVLSWDKSNRQLRARQETERHARQSENESHIDELFNDNEIGYADIAGLEKEFQLEEAGKKYKEDHDELESFTREVYQHVVEKIEDEITGLVKMQTVAAEVLESESVSAARQIQGSMQQLNKGSPSTPESHTTAVVQLLLEIHDKLEIRHIKVAEANFERERRKKRLEQSILYTNNDKAGIKKLEAEYTKAEKIQILEENRRKAERVSRLLDRLDKAVIRGLAENQDLMDDILGKVKALRDSITNAGPDDSAQTQVTDDAVKDLMLETSYTLSFLLNDGKTLLQLLNKADIASNEADFALYVSEAKLSGASADKFEKLKKEKDAEDRNIASELATRLNGISRVPGEVEGLLGSVKERVGESDTAHKERIGRALEEAKKRNANLGT